MFAAELSDLLRTRVKDPRVGFASITHVEVSGDYRHAKIYVSVMGSEEERTNTMKALKHATGFLRHELASRVVLRYMPEIVFKLDTSIEQGSRILDLIHESEESYGRATLPKTQELTEEDEGEVVDEEEEEDDDSEEEHDE